MAIGLACDLIFDIGRFDIYTVVLLLNCFGLSTHGDSKECQCRK